MLQWGKPTCQLMMVRKINSSPENTNRKPEHSLLPTHSPQKEHQIRQDQAVRDGERQKQNHSVLTPKNRWKQEHYPNQKKWLSIIYSDCCPIYQWQLQHFSISSIKVLLKYPTIELGLFLVEGRLMGFPVAQMVKCLSTMWETWVRSLGWEDPLEKEMATHSSTLA